MPVIKDDTFHVDQTPGESVHGAKPEPEERIVAHVLTTEGSALTGRTLAGEHSDIVGYIPTQIIAEMTAEDAAMAVGAQCGRCKHFDQAAWVEKYRDLKVSGDPKTVAYVNKLRMMFMLSDDQEVRRRHMHADGQVNPEHGITSMGLCKAFAGNPLCYPESACPSGFPPKWEGKTPKIAAETAAKRDQLMRGASLASKK